MIYLLTFSLLILTVLVLVIVSRYMKRSWIILLLIPFLLFNIGFSWHTVNEILGQPRIAIPMNRVELLFAITNQPHIYILVKHHDKNDPTFYKFKYSKQLEEKINEAHNKVKRGHRMYLNLIDKEGSEGTMEFYEFDHFKNLPKKID